LFNLVQDSEINRLLSQIIFVLLIASSDVYAYADTDTQLPVPHNSNIEKSDIIVDDFDDDLPFIIASQQQSKPIIIVALLPSVASLTIITPDVIDGHGIRAPPIFFS